MRRLALATNLLTEGSDPASAPDGVRTAFVREGDTGLHVRNPDGSLFFSIGIVPDVEVPVIAADLRDGVDRDLLMAIELPR